MASRLALPFGPHGQWNKADIDARQALIQRICEVIWGAGVAYE